MKEDRKEEIAKKTPTLDRCLKTMKQTTREEINHLVYLDPIVKNIPEREIKKLFKPEFIARVDEVINFNHLDKDSLMQIIQREIEGVYDGLGSIGVEAMFNPGLAEYIYNEVKDRKDGARFVINTVKQMVSKPIAREKAKEPFQKVTSTIENGSIVFEYK
mgnify:CR=1 FL=1